MLSLEWGHVDMAALGMRLLRAYSKNKEPRVLVLTGDLLDLMARRVAARVEGCSWVFHREVTES